MSGRPVPSRANRPDPNRLPGLDPDEQNAAMTGATVTLTQHIAALTGAVARNTAALAAERLKQAASLNPGGGGPVKPPAASPGILSRLGGMLSTSLTAFATKVVAPLAPLAVLSQLLGHANSGFGAFISMTKLFTTLLAGLLMPAFVMLSGLLFAATTILAGGFNKVLVKLADDQLTAFGAALEVVTDQLDGINEVLGAFGMSLKDVMKIITLPTIPGAAGALKEHAPETFEAMKKALGGLPGIIGRNSRDKGNKGPEWDAWREGVDPAAPGVTDPKTGKHRKPGSGADLDDFQDQVWKGMELALKQIQRDLSPAARNEGIAQAWKSAQMATLNADPIAMEANKIARQQLEALMQLVQKHRPPTTH